MSIETGSEAPDFILPVDGGDTITLSKLRGKPVVLYFYPKDDTSGCTAQACDFRDAMPHFAGVGATIVGISKDSVQSHDKFKAKYGLSFPLASDATGHVCEDYGVWMEKSMYGKTYMGIDRTTVLIDAAGKVAKIWRKVRVPGHVAEVTEAVKTL